MKIKKGIHPMDIKDQLVPEDKVIEHIVKVISENAFVLSEKKTYEPVTGIYHPYPHNSNVKTELSFSAVDPKRNGIGVGIYRILLNDGKTVYQVRISIAFGSPVMDRYFDNRKKRLDVTATEISDFDEDITSFIKKVR